MLKILNYIKWAAISGAVVFGGIALAQTLPVTLDPRTWFQSQDTVFLAVALITPTLTKIFTALFKDYFSTDGAATQWLSLAVAAVLGGIGGYLSLGYLAGAGGWSAALQAAGLTAIAFFVSNGMAKGERQVALSTAKRLSEIQSNKD